MGKLLSIFLLFVTLSSKYVAVSAEQKLLTELTNGVLVRKVGYMLQGGGFAHALVKLNISRLASESSNSCDGVTRIEEFIEKVLSSTSSEERIKIIGEIKPLVETLRDVCGYIKSQLLNLVQTFQLHGMVGDDYVAENLGLASDDLERSERGVGTVIISSVIGSLASSAFNVIYEAITGGSSNKLVGIVEEHEDKLHSIELQLGNMNHTLSTVADLLSQTRSTLHITTTLEVVVNNQFLMLTALRSTISGFFDLLKGN